MNITHTQRWNDSKRAVFIPPAKTFIPRLHEVAPIPESQAKDFCIKYHYSCSVPALRRRFGLFRHGHLVGVCLFSHSMNNRTLTNAFGGEANESLELGRLVLLDNVEFNGESFLINYCRRALRKEGFRGIVTFADPMCRTTTTGEIVMPGHAGICYAASSAIYTGLTDKATVHILPDGKIFSKRAVSKIRNNESGHEYASRILTGYGASEPPSDPVARKLWLEIWLKKLTRKATHPGNHRYLIPLQKKLSLPSSLPYPKVSLKNNLLSII